MIAKDTLIIFIPGLSTYNDDRFHCGPFTFEYIHSHIQSNIEKWKMPFLPILGLGQQSISHSVELACKQISSTCEKTPAKITNLILIGQSRGGLIARALAHKTDLPQVIKKIITIATPHYGTPLAQSVLDLPSHHPLTSRLLKIMSYDLAKKSKYFLDFTKEASDKFNAQFPNKNYIIYESIVCGEDFAKLPLGFRLMSQFASVDWKDQKTDGMVPTQSQIWGTVLGNFELDHIAQLGFSKHLFLRESRRAILIYNEMMNLIKSSVI